MEGKLSVHHIVPRIHNESSGTTYVVPRLCDALHRQGVDTHLHVIRAGGQQYDFHLHIHPSWPGLERLGVSLAMKKSLRQAADQPTVILHNHGLWMMPNVYPGKVKAGAVSPIKLVVSPHGTMSPYALAQSPGKKKIFSCLFGQKVTLLKADLFHATSAQEVEENRSQGYHQKIALIPYGVDFGQQFTEEPDEVRTVLFLGRLHPIKGLEELLVAWLGVEKALDNGCQLLIAGPEGKAGYRTFLEEKIRSLELKQARLLGPVYGNDKQKLLAKATLFIMPSHSENFNVTIAEALYQATPVIASRHTPWQAVEDQHCGWWVANDPASLEQQLLASLRMSEQEMGQMGANGRAWVESQFDWHQVGEKMQQTYAWLCGQGVKPDWIIDE